MFHADPPSNGFSYKTILALSTWDLTQEELEVYVPCSTYVLLGLARFTKIFKKTYHFNEIEELIVKNAVAGFVASFLLKICTLFNAGCTLLRLIDPIEEDGSEKELRNINGAALNLFRCSVFNVSTMLTSIGCIPNVLSHRTIDHKFVILALLPIKKGTRLILFGQSNPSIFYSKPKSERQSMHYNYYKCPCICQACTEDWPVDFNELNTKTVDYSDCELQELEKFRNDLKSVMNQWNTHLLARKPNYPDIKTVNKVKSLVTASWKYFPLPSIMMIVSANLMVTILGCFYHPDKNMFTSSLSAYNIDTVKVT
ncbi:hypothetical protein QAD02_010722 [Eretmocerus hayati]|uniref:Uncharacterized protein n=1 Tax=Eretmocerus hayati TaxID=131215 RepID=A0ACC2NWF0_9HYME|nr:hypothetical protein QAD02_010722 [Eretmocerus hayati]